MSRHWPPAGRGHPCGASMQDNTPRKTAWAKLCWSAPPRCPEGVSSHYNYYYCYYYHRPRLTVDAAVCAVGPAAALLRLVDLDVGHVQGVRVQALHLHPASQPWENNRSVSLPFPTLPWHGSQSKACCADVNMLTQRPLPARQTRPAPDFANQLAGFAPSAGCKESRPVP